MLIKDIDIEIIKPRVLRNLGYKKVEDVVDSILLEVETAINEVKEIIKPQICYEIHEFESDEYDKRIIFHKDCYFSNENLFKELSHMEYIVVAVSTLGEAIDKKIKEAFSSSNYLRSLIYDAVANEAMISLNHMLWKKLVTEMKEKNYGLTRSFSPGSNGWDIKDQKVIFSLLKPKEIGVYLNEKYMMEPNKSITLVFGAAKGIGFTNIDHDCSYCSLKDCQFRDISKNTHTITIHDSLKAKKILVSDGENLLDILIKNNSLINNYCGGNHSCGKCKVLIESKEAMAMTENEKRLLSYEDIDKGIRLACFVNTHHDMDVYINNSNSKAKIIKESNYSHIKINSRVKTNRVKLPIPTFRDSRDSITRLKESIELEHSNISLSCIQKLASILEKNNEIYYTLYDNEIVDVNTIPNEEKIYGLAIDIGTTTLVVYLINLENGNEEDIYYNLNPQRICGADVINRINYTLNNSGGLHHLHCLVKDEINKAIDVFKIRNNISSNEIFEIMIAGNTVMLHLFLGIPCKGISISPYIPVFTHINKIKARELGIDINAEGYVRTLPNISGYIGGDTISALLSCGMYKDENINILIDIGTNGEIVLGNKDKLYCCSVAAGPAFEGSNITFGMASIDGAIDHIELDCNPIYTTIGNIRPLGICGSGVIDCAAELLRFNILDKSGRLKKKDELLGMISEALLERIVEYEGQTAFVIDEESGILITQKDIRELQLAKGAIYAGINVLIKKMRIKIEDIEKVYIAGGFGNYMDIDNALDIKLVQSAFKGRIIPIGNGAGSGAKMALLSDEILQESRNLKRKMKYIELSNLAEFQAEFIKGMSF